MDYLQVQLSSPLLFFLRVEFIHFPVLGIFYFLFSFIINILVIFTHEGIQCLFKRNDSYKRKPLITLKKDNLKNLDYICYLYWLKFKVLL